MSFIAIVVTSKQIETYNFDKNYSSIKLSQELVQKRKVEVSDPP